MKTEHTPTPWEVRPPTLSGAVPSWREVVGVRKKGLPVYIGGAHEWDAEFIVRACNNHERLVDALRKILYCAEHGDTSNPRAANLDFDQIEEFANAALKELDQ